MKYNKNIAVLIFAVLIGLSIAYSFYFTSSVISDIDPTTYVIIPIIMLPIFAFFYIKDNISISIKKRDLLFGIVFFILGIITTIFMSVYFSFEFLSYRLDLFILPFIILSLVSLLFGIKNLKRFIPLVLYSILASPVFIIILIGQNAAFAAVNTQIVYTIISFFVKGVSYLSPITILANGYRIGIGEGCVGLGILIAILFLLAPIAYFYNGKIKNKIIWILSGFFIILLLNIFRMILIALIWIFYGPTQALSIFHEFAGILIFYISIIIILLISYKFNLTLPNLNKNRGSYNKNNSDMIFKGIVFASIFAFIYFYVYSGIIGAYISPSLYVNTVTGNAGIKQLLSNIYAPLYNEEIIQQNNIYAIGLFNNSQGINQTEPMLFSDYNKSYVYANTSVLSSYSYGITGNAYYIMSNGLAFVVYERDIIYNINNQTYSILHLYAVVPANEAEHLSCSNSFQEYNLIYNVILLRLYNNTVYNALNNVACEVNNVVIK